MDRSETLWALFAGSYEKRKLRGGSVATRKQYAIQLRHFAAFLGHEPTIADLSDDALGEFLDWLSTDRAAPTVNKAYWCVVALWRHAADLGLIAVRPTILPLVEPETIPFAWLLEELRRLLVVCSVATGQIGGLPARLWWPGLHWVIWSSGERIGAVLAVKKADINLARGEMFVPAAARKGRRKPKLYSLLPQAVELLGQLDGFDRELLFPLDCDQVTLYNRYNRILKAAGLPTDRKCKFHRLRRSFASYLTAAGGDATEALDHSSSRVTKRSYLDPRICQQENPAARLPRLDPPEAA